MDAPALDLLLTAMSSPSFYPHQPARVEVRQTHISWVFLAGDHVYKVKKPVRFSFLDFSTLELRRHYCHEEVRLNRRLAPDTYLGVEGLRSRADGVSWCAADAPDVLETAVHMRRLPADRMLPELLARDAVDGQVIDRIVARLVEFHRRADRGPRVRAYGDPDRLTQAMDRDFVEMDRFRAITVDPDDDDLVRNFLRARIAAQAPLLRRRCDEGRVCEGHGDLHAEHVCILEHGDISIFDCIEFSEEFRCRDVAAELAFLAMDFEFRGHPQLARQLVASYADRAGDADLARLIPLFACHRAYIRGKVDSLKSAEPEVDGEERTAAAASARRHFELASRYTWVESPLLVVIHGLSGTGKSTLARSLATRTGFAHLASDAIRKELAGLDPTNRAGAHGWLYSPEMSARTYSEMFARAAGALERGQGVLVDATFQRHVDRDAARKIARRVGTPFLLVECVSPEAEVIERLERRHRRDDDASDADVAVYRAQVAAYEAWNDEDAATGVRVDTRAIEPARRRVEHEMRRRLAAATPRR